MSAAPERPVAAPLRFAESLGAGLLGVAEQAGAFGVLGARLASRLFPPRLDKDELLRNLHRMGVRSLPIVLGTALFTGFIMTIQAAVVIGRYDAEGLLGWAVGFVTLREVGPILIALMFSGRVGANNTAELATMTVTEQIDGLRALAIDPLSYLILPRALAMIALLFILTVYGDLFALGGAAFMGELMLEVPRQTFYRGMIDLLGPWDLAVGLVKSVVFGGMIAIASCHFGLSVKGGAPGVGRAVNASVVASASGVFVLDYFVTYLLR